MTIVLHCVICGGTLGTPGATHAVCTVCGHGFPHTLGILDLRPPELISADDDEAPIVAALLAAYPRTVYADLVTLRFELSADAARNTPELRAYYARYTAGQAERGQRMAAMFADRLADHFPSARRATALDLGCGSGAGLLYLAARYAEAAGVDPSLANLILARKALEEAGRTNVTLVRGYGQRLPFADGVFDHCSAQNVLEHVFAVEPVLREAARVLGPGGGFAADSRNRYDLLFPEPHVHIRWVGLLPRKLAPWYVRRRTGLRYDHTYLLSYGELRRGMRRAFGAHQRITFPAMSAYGYPAIGDRLTRTIERVPGVRRLALQFFPSLLALGYRP
jgi:ubiquinone/menaquinone biosynthesis C-methylase UbiE